MELFWFFWSGNSLEHMRIPKVVAFKVAFIWKLKSLFRSSEAFKIAFIWKLKSLFRSSEGYLKPGGIFMMKLLAVNYFCKKALSFCIMSNKIIKCVIGD